MSAIEISGLRLADLGATDVTIVWRTSLEADSRWEIEPVLDYGALTRTDRQRIVAGPELVFHRSGSDPRLSTEHEVRIDGLSPGFGYYLRVRGGSPDGLGPAKQLLFTTVVPIPAVPPSGAPLKDLLLARARELDARQKAERAAIGTLDELRAYQQRIRGRFVERLGGLPERTPLNARTIRVIDRGGYSIENVVFESLPGFCVPGNLYLPKGLSGPAPCALGVCGHAVAAKSERQLVQMANINLVRKGYVTLQIDPPGQNEMGWDGSPWTFADMHTNASGYAHHLEALNAILVGQSLTRFFLWDGIRAIDYLAARPEVDADRIGIWGCSGGGGQSLYIAAIDERVKAALCMSMIYDTVATMMGPHAGHNRRGGESFLTEETYPITLLSEGLSTTAVAALIAPRALVLETASHDAQPLWTTQIVYDELKGIYDRVGAADKLSLAAIQGFHCCHSVRQLVYWTFNRELGDPEAGVGECDTDLLPSSVGPDGRRQPTPLDVGAHSSMVEDFGSETARTLIQRSAAALASRRPTPSSCGGWSEYCGEIRQRTRECLGLDAPTPCPQATVTGETRRDACLIRRLACKVEPGMALRLEVYEPDAARTGAAVLYLHDRVPADGELIAEGSALWDLVRSGRTVAALAVRGSNETAPFEDEVRSGISTYATRRAHDALAVGRPLIGQHVLDVLAAIETLSSRGPAGPLVVIGDGAAGLWGLFAAVSSERVGSLAVRASLASYERILRSPLATWIQGDRENSVVLPGALELFDLPDLVSVLAPRHVLLSRLVDGSNGVLPAAEVEREYARARRRFEERGAGNRLSICDHEELRGWQGLEA